MKEHFLKEEICYRKNEFEDGKLTLVFIHGLSGSSSAWWPYEKILGNKYNILAFDTRGHGKSKKFKNCSDYEIRHFAEDLHSLVSHLNISKFVLVSHSFGSLVAAEYLKLHREKVSAVVFLSPIFNLEKTFVPKIWKLILKFAGLLSLLPFKSKSGQHIDYPLKFPNSTDWDIGRCRADVSNTTLRVYSFCLKQALGGEEYFLDKIQVPTLIVHGTKDTMAPVKNSISLAKKIENPDLALVEGGNHMLVLNEAKEMSDTIESFLEKHREIC